MEEIWKKIEGYPNYCVSNKGNVKSLNYRNTGKEQILKPRVNKYGYLQVVFYKNGKGKEFRINRIVAMAFLPNPNNYPQVNHIDENKKNNCVENLEYCTAKYNNNYGTRNERAAAKTTNGKCSKKVLQINKLTNEVIAEFPSTIEVHRQLCFDNSAISKCCLGKQKSAYGFKWQFKNER